MTNIPEDPVNAMVEDLALMLTDREFRGWKFYWKHPGVFVWEKEGRSLYATPWYDGDENIIYQLEDDLATVEIEIPFPIPDLKSPGGKSYHMQRLFEDYLFVTKNILLIKGINKLILTETKEEV